MEAIAIPLSFLVLIWVFGGLLSAALPLMVGMVAILDLRLCYGPIPISPTCRYSR